MLNRHGFASAPNLCPAYVSTGPWSIQLQHAVSRYLDHVSLIRVAPAEYQRVGIGAIFDPHVSPIGYGHGYLRCVMGWLRPLLAGPRGYTPASACPLPARPACNRRGD